MVKKFKSWLNILFLTLILFTPGVIFAGTLIKTGESSPIDRLNEAAQKSGPYTQVATETTLASTLGLLINVALSILGVVFIAIFIMAGYQWMTAQGNEQTVTKAKDSMTRAVIGIIVVISSYAIWTFIKTTFISQI